MPDVNEAKRALLAHYEQERDELNTIIARLRRELGVADVSVQAGENVGVGAADVARTSTGANNVNEIVRPGDFFGQTQVQATRQFLERCKQPATLQEIASALHRGKVTDRLIEGPGPLRNLSSVLSRSDEFISVARGRWGLREWYPSRSVRKGKKGTPQAANGGAETEGQAGGGEP
jgi:HB1, ASXL, restriction endonuclease HTH domain